MQVSSFDVAETSIESDADEVDPLIPHDEEAGSPLNVRESSYFKQIDSKESSNFLEGEDAKTGLESILRFKSYK